jgi:hypothetical protein
MVQLGFREIGNVLEFRNSEEDRTAAESCMTMLSVLIGNAFIYLASNLREPRWRVIASSGKG